MLNMASLLAIGFRPRDRLAVLGPNSVKAPAIHHRAGLYRRTYIPLSTPMSEQISQLEDFRPNVLWSYPSAFRALLHNLDRPLTSVMNPRILITSAEVFDEVLKERVRGELDADWYNFYLAHEFGQIAWECPEHRGLHLNCDQFVLECMNNGVHAKIGQQGVTIVTSLYSFAMPMIRYNLGDLCSYSMHRCTCGCSFPLLDPPTGREHDLIAAPSGKLFSPQRVAHILCGFDGIAQWRLIQETRSHFVLKLAMTGRLDDDSLEKIRDQFFEYLEEPVTLDIEFVEFMDEKTLKFRTFVSKIGPSLE
jgi:phenylacetate-CoA ligase